MRRYAEASTLKHILPDIRQRGTSRQQRFQFAQWRTWYVFQQVFRVMVVESNIDLVRFAYSHNYQEHIGHSFNLVPFDSGEAVQVMRQANTPRAASHILIVQLALKGQNNPAREQIFLSVLPKKSNNPPNSNQ
jgi:hypothetical protein